MHENILASAARLSDEALIAHVLVLSQQSRTVTVELLVHLAELDRRKLYRGQGTGKLFPYCTEVLRLSGAAAYNRIKAARAARRFPVILDLLADGRVNLTTIRLLAPHLTAENHSSLLDEAQGMTRRQVDKLVARIAPRPDVKPSIRRLPPPRDGDGGRPTTATPREEAPSSASLVSTTAPAETTGVSTNPPRPVPDGHRPVVAPLSPERYRLQITIEEDAHDDLRCLQDLKCGRRCTERSYIEYHHANEPHALGGVATVENISLRCRAHNVYESELIFGPFDPTHLRETPAIYEVLGPAGNWSRDQ